MAVAYLVIAVLPDWIGLSPATLSTLEIVDWTITGFFALEYAIRFFAAESRSGYAKEHWLDLLAIVPLLRWLRIARVARVFRVLRVLRVVRVFNSLEYMGVSFARFTSLNGVQWMVLVLTGAMFAGSAVIYYSEAGINPGITSYGQALYVSLLTWLGPGFGELNAETTAGRTTGIVLVVTGMATWGIMISNLAAFFTVRSKSAAVRSARQRLLRLDDLSEEDLLDLRQDIVDITEKRIKKRRRREAIKPKI
jgi:voltage-gated potassium channel